MRMPTAAQLLDAWDELRDSTTPHRAATLVALADPALTPDQVSAMPLGRRDLRLLDLRASLFGGAINGISRCPACAEAVETPFFVDHLTAGLTAGAPDRTAECEDGSWRVRYRAPTAADACALAATGGDARALAVQCVIEAREDGAAVERKRLARALPDAILAAIAAGVPALDPAADLLLDVTCPVCGHRWNPPFDVAAFLWVELTAWARRTLHDVACLASAYGWREPDILAMSPRRRADYLEMLTT